MPTTPQEGFLWTLDNETIARMKSASVLRMLIEQFAETAVLLSTAQGTHAKRADAFRSLAQLVQPVINAAAEGTLVWSESALSFPGFKLPVLRYEDLNADVFML